MSPPCRFLKVCEEATRNPSSCEAKNAKFLHFPQPILWSKYYWRKTALSDILYWKKIVPKPRQRTLSAPSQRLENSISRFDRRPTCPAATTGCYGPPLCIRPIGLLKPSANSRMSTSVPQAVLQHPSCALPNQRRPVLPQVVLQETLPCCWRQALASAWRLCSPIHLRNQHDEQRHGRGSFHHPTTECLAKPIFSKKHDLSRTNDLDLWLLQSKNHHSVQARRRRCLLGDLNSKRQHQEEDEISYGLIIKVKEKHLN